MPNKKRSPAIYKQLIFFPLFLILAGCTQLQHQQYLAEVYRSKGGIPHIKADSYANLGFGTGYAMAEDNVCQLADLYLTLGAQRSRYFGNNRDNLNSDFLYQLFIDRATGEELLIQEMTDLFQGTADGYNHYLRKTGVNRLTDPNCRAADWVNPISQSDIRRVSRFDYAFAHLLPLLIAAQPPATDSITTSSSLPGQDTLAIASAIENFMEIPKQGGSNGIALGREVTANRRGMLLTNPHLPWHGSQRFYPMHHIIPGKLNVMGANLIGRPRIGFGHTENIAWTSTVSTAKRIAFYQLQLVPGDPTSYLFDGKAKKMKAETVTVLASMPDGSLTPHSFTFYSTHFGLMVKSEHFPWTNETAYSIRLPDVVWRAVNSSTKLYSARSVRELKAINDSDQSMPVNLIAADRHGETLFADPGAIPYIDDDMLARCSKLHGAALDGSRSDCQWKNDKNAAAPGIFSPEKLPYLYRDDFVMNSNDSYWLSNPLQPLEGFAKILGSEKTQRTLRTRSGLKMIQRRLDGSDGLPGSTFTLENLQTLAFDNQNYAGQILRDDLVTLCLANPLVTLNDNTVVDLKAACRALSTWDLHSDNDSRGAHVFRQFLSEANHQEYFRWLPKSFSYAVPFDASDPINTPRGLLTDNNPAVLDALARAVHSLQRANIALDAKLGDLQHVTRNNQRIAIHGGQEQEGVFNKIEAPFQGNLGYPEIKRGGSSWVMATEFTDHGPRAKGILTYSLSVNPKSPHYDDQTRLFSNKQWLTLPFHEQDVVAASVRSYVVSGR